MSSCLMGVPCHDSSTFGKCKKALGLCAETD
jgi:hypothetical protein